VSGRRRLDGLALGAQLRPAPAVHCPRDVGLGEGHAAAVDLHHHEHVDVVEHHEIAPPAMAEVLVAGRRIRFEGVDVRPTAVAPVVRLHGILGSDLGDAAVLRLDWLNGRFGLF
jgi:hypothetical protein